MNRIPLPSESPRALVSGLLLGAAGAMAFSAKAIIVKLAYRYGVDAVTVIFYRMLFALPLFLALSWWAGRGKPALTPRDWSVLAGLGFCGYYLASLLDFLGLQFIGAGLERVILYLHPTIVVVAGWLLYRTPIGRWQVLALAVSYAGALVVFGHDLSVSGGQTLLGSALVFGSAVSYALYLVFCGAAVKRFGALRLTGLATSVACLMCIAQFFALRPVSAMWVAPPVIWLSLLNATLCTFVPVLLVMLAIERVGAGVTAQTGSIGPVSTIGLSAVFLDEPFTVWMGLGTLLVLAGVWLLVRGRERTRRVA